MVAELKSKRRELIDSLDYINKSQAFLLPMLETPMYHQNKDINYLIQVSFLQMGFPQIILIFDNIDYEPLKEDIHRLSMNYCYTGCEYGDDEKEICLFFDVPKEFRSDFEKFTSGSYSKFRSKFKDLLIKSHGTRRQSGLSEKTFLPNIGVYEAIYPDDKLRKLMARCLSTDNHIVNWLDIGEVLEAPNLEYEEFKTIEELYAK